MVVPNNICTVKCLEDLDPLAKSFLLQALREFGSVGLHYVRSIARKFSLILNLSRIICMQILIQKKVKYLNCSMIISCIK